MTVWNLVLAVHILAMTAWVGGMAYALLVLRPAVAVLQAGGDRIALHGAALRRFMGFAWVAMPLVVLSGWGMVAGVYGGFAHLPWPVNVMQVIGLVMAVVFVWTALGPWRRFRRAPEDAALVSIRKLMHANLGFGVITIVVASFAHWG